MGGAIVTDARDLDDFVRSMRLTGSRSAEAETYTVAEILDLVGRLLPPRPADPADDPAT